MEKGSGRRFPHYSEAIRETPKLNYGIIIIELILQLGILGQEV